MQQLYTSFAVNNITKKLKELKKMSDGEFRKNISVIIPIFKKEVLVLKRSDKVNSWKNCWGFPGGGVEEGESFAEAAVRELKEEAGIDVNLSDLRFLKQDYSVSHSGEERWVSYYTVILSHYPVVILNDESTQFLMTTPDTLIELEFVNNRVDISIVSDLCAITNISFNPYPNFTNVENSITTKSKSTEIQEPASTDLDRVQELIVQECDAIKNLLLTKNREYGNSAIQPKRIFSKASSSEQIRVRIDDKLSRLMSDSEKTIKEDTLQDLIGYLILLKISELA